MSTRVNKLVFDYWGLSGQTVAFPVSLQPAINQEIYGIHWFSNGQVITIQQKTWSTHIRNIVYLDWHFTFFLSPLCLFSATEKTWTSATSWSFTSVSGRCAPFSVLCDTSWPCKHVLFSWMCCFRHPQKLHNELLNYHELTLKTEKNAVRLWEAILKGQIRALPSLKKEPRWTYVWSNVNMVRSTKFGWQLQRWFSWDPDQVQLIQQDFVGEGDLRVSLLTSKKDLYKKDMFWVTMGHPYCLNHLESTPTNNDVVEITMAEGPRALDFNINGSPVPLRKGFLTW